MTPISSISSPISSAVTTGTALLQAAAMKAGAYATWCGKTISVGIGKLSPLIIRLATVSSELFNQVVAVIGTKAGISLVCSIGLLPVALFAHRMAARPEYQDPDQRAVRALWRTVAACAAIGAVLSASSGIGVYLSV